MHSLPDRRVLLLALVAALLPVLACRSSTQKAEMAGKPEPFVPLPDEGPETIGYFLMRFDRSLQQWSELELASSSMRERHALSALEANLEKRARERREELLEVLESGAPVNRRIAAAALGFTHDPSVLGPLLASLSDRDPELVQKALLALGVLALPDTPLAGIRQLLATHPDPWTRNNAAFALLAIARAGNRSSELAEGCRDALSDAEPGVRAQCASALGVLTDAAALPQLAGLLYDEANLDLVALAAAAALAHIGREHAELKGTAARHLALALDEVHPDRRVHLLGALRWLAEEDHGEDAGPWLEWAHKMP